MRRSRAVAWLAALVLGAAGAACHDVDALAPCPSGTLPLNGSCQNVPPSCAGLGDTCGPDRDESCCKTAIVSVQGVLFQRGVDQGGNLQGNVTVPHQQPATSSPVSLGPFSLDRYEVTVARFRAFVAHYDDWKNNGLHAGDGADPYRAGLMMLPDGGPSPEAWNLAWNSDPRRVPVSSADLLERIEGRTDAGYNCGSLDGTGAPSDYSDTPGPDDNHPMTCVTWYEAMMFCIWDGGRLPTEAEWEFAAAGGAEQRAFPWSAPPSDTTASSDHANLKLANGLQALADVGRFPLGMGRYFQYDLAGNAYEWTVDTVPPQSLDTYVPEGVEPLDTSGGGAYRIVRGGSYEYAPVDARTSARRLASSTERDNDIGLRCAR